jgi:hypothetical protein
MGPASVFVVLRALTDFKPNANQVLQINSCVQEAGTFYTLSFDPSHADSPDEYHDLKVQVDTHHKFPSLCKSRAESLLTGGNIPHFRADHSL